jgi:Na+/citrate or Na+/malate symporter
LKTNKINTEGSQSVGQEKDERKKLQIGGMNIFLWISACAIIIAASLLGVLPNNMAGAVALCFGAGLISFAVGDRLPIFNSYLGGGVILTMFLGSSISHFKLLPQVTLDTVKNFIGAWGFLNIFIIVLIVGSIMMVDRNLLLKAVYRFIPTILAALAGSMIVGVIIGLFFGMTPEYTICYFVLPIMAAGSGSGALPLAEMYSQITGANYEEYLSVAMAMLSVGNIIAIIMAAVLSRLVEGNTKLSGQGELLKIARKGTANEEKEKNKTKPLTMDDYSNALLMIFSIYMLAIIFNKIILPTVFGVSIHTFAYAVIITVVMKVSNILPENLTNALIHTQKFFVATFVVVIMFCCGLAYVKLSIFVDAISNIGNLLVCFGVVAGAILGGGLFGSLMGFYPFEAGVTSGLCMANSGGTGDIAVLSACKRMNLIPYAQISSRIGNAMILIISSAIFAFFA